jgi:hypothetical protein
VGGEFVVEFKGKKREKKKHFTKKKKNFSAALMP